MPATDLVTVLPATRPRGLRPRVTAARLRAVAHVATALLLAAAAVALWPAALGGATSYVVVSGDSMLPTLTPGDLVVLRDRSSYEVGDLVAYRPAATDVAARAVVIHRLGPRLEDGSFTARGDNNDFDDPWTVTPERVLGESWLVVPSVGTAVTTLRSPLSLGLLAAGLVVWGVLGASRPAQD